MRARAGLLFLLVHVLARARGQYDLCKSLVTTDDGALWEHYACQPKAQSVKEYMRIRVEPPGVTCGNPPERFCTLVSSPNLLDESGKRFHNVAQMHYERRCCGFSSQRIRTVIKVYIH